MVQCRDSKAKDRSAELYLKDKSILPSGSWEVGTKIPRNKARQNERCKSRKKVGEDVGRLVVQVSQASETKVNRAIHRSVSCVDQRFAVLQRNLLVGKKPASAVGRGWGDWVTTHLSSSLPGRLSDRCG